MTGLSRLRRLMVLAGAVAISAAAIWAFLGTAGDDVAGNFADAGNIDQVAEGQRIYARDCASCHGAAREGQPNWRQRKPDGRIPAPPHDASGHTWHHDDGTLFGVTKFGPAEFSGTDYASDMPAYKDSLSDAEIWAVLAYIKSEWPADIQRRQARMTKQAMERQR